MNAKHLFPGPDLLRLAALFLSVSALLVFSPPLPAAAQNTAPIVFEAEALLGTAQASSGQIVRQDMAGFGSGWSGNAQLFWGAPQPGAELRLHPDLPDAGLYEIRLFLTVAPDFGIVETKLGDHVIRFDAYNDRVALREATLGNLQLAAGPQELKLRIEGKFETSSGYFLGIDRIEFRPVGAQAAQAVARMPKLRTSSVTPPTSPPEPAPAENLEPWTTQDVIDSRIDVAAQYGLMRMLTGEPEERIVSSNILSAVKDGTLGGIYQEDQQVPALRAQASGYGWWQILPKSATGSKVDSICMTDPAAKAPVIVMRKKAETNPAAYDKALQDAWYDCALPPAPVRPYAKTLPDKQPAAKATRCSAPGTDTDLVVGLTHWSAASGKGTAVAGAKVLIEGQNTVLAKATDANGFAHFTLSAGGLYLVTVQSIPGATGPAAINKTVEVLPQCTTWTNFIIGQPEPVDPCEKVEEQWRDCVSPEIKKGNNDCNAAYIKSDSECSGDTDCRNWAKANYDACLQVLRDEIAACRAKLPKQVVCTSGG